MCLAVYDDLEPFKFNVLRFRFEVKIIQDPKDDLWRGIQQILDQKSI